MKLERIILSVILYFALIVQSYRYLNGSFFYGEYLHWTGVQSTRLLILAMAVTPLFVWFPKNAILQWLKRRRRDIGIATFVYAAAHTSVYLAKQGSLQKILDASLAAEIWTAWIALLVLLLLAITSNNYSVRRLRQRWKTLHRWVYLGAFFTFAHWLLAAFNPAPAYWHLALLAALVLFRLLGMRRTA